MSTGGGSSTGKYTSKDEGNRYQSKRQASVKTSQYDPFVSGIDNVKNPANLSGLDDEFKH